MTADDLRALSAAATPGPWDGHYHTIFEPLENTPDGEAGAEVADVGHPEDLELIVWLRNHAEALADLIDAVAAHKASFDNPNADVVVRARSATFVALDALDQEATA
jgi:hypothetical protein